MKRLELDEKIVDDDAVVPSITIFSYEPAPLLALGDILRFRLEWEQKPQKVNVRRISCAE